MYDAEYDSTGVKDDSEAENTSSGKQEVATRALPDYFTVSINVLS